MLCGMCLLCCRSCENVILFVNFHSITLKLTMLLMLTITARTQTIQLLSIEGMRRTESDVTLTLTGLLKQSRPGYCPSEMTFKMYLSDPRSCAVKTLDEYLVKTKKLRNTNTLLKAIQSHMNLILLNVLLPLFCALTPG